VLALRSLARRHQQLSAEIDQLAELTRTARREGVEIVSVRRDDGISASRYAATKQREGWRDVMATILDGRVTELWVWEISRATRDRPV
jgi:site-specific DNA recombinase